MTGASVKNQKEPLFLLTYTPYRESDLIINLLSSQQGLLSAVIYGGRKIGKASTFLHQPGDLLEIEYQLSENREFIRVLNIASLESIDADRFSYKRFLFHSYLVEIISRISQPGNPSADLYEILLKNNRLKWKEPTVWFQIARLIWLLCQHGGFGIDYHGCSHCGRPSWREEAGRGAIFRKEVYRFDQDSGSLVCSQCVQIGDASESLTPSMLKVMWLLDMQESDADGPINIPHDVMVSVINCLNHYLLQRFELKPKSLALFLESLS